MEPNKRMNVFKLLRHPFITGISEIVEEIGNRKNEENRNYLQVIRRNTKPRNLSLIPEKDENLSFSDVIENNKNQKYLGHHIHGVQGVHGASTGMIESDFKASQYYEDDHRKISPKKIDDSSIIDVSIMNSKFQETKVNGALNTIENSPKISKKFTIHLNNIDDIDETENEEVDLQENAIVGMQPVFQTNSSEKSRDYKFF